jgi:DNA repair protein RecO (recombination protein O)
MTFKTKGIVLRTLKYGETSLIVNIYTELFGLQSYIINGVRTYTKKGPGKANLFQPSAILDLLIYHNELKNLQRLKEFKWNFLYQHILSDVPRNAVALFMVELLQKTIKQPDSATPGVVANFPLFFALRLSSFFGFGLSDEYSEQNQILNLEDGVFTNERPSHPYYIEGQFSSMTSRLLRIKKPAELDQVKLNQDFRRKLLQSYQDFFALHISDFGTMKTLPILQEVLG